MVNSGSKVWTGMRVMGLLACICLSGCLDDDGNKSPTAANSTAATGAASTSGNRAPAIGGTAITAVTVGSPYSFTPSTSDADGDPLTFSISNKPSWATFSTLTGSLTGTPGTADIGTYANIAISVSDGTATTALTAFSVAVSQIGIGAATLSWQPPTEYADGPPLVDLSGYRIYYGTNSGNLDQSVKIDNASINRYQISNLSPATWYFAIKAYTASGLESSFSAIASKTIR
jgi:hypothetical protein